MLVDAEQLARDNRALTPRLKEAKLRLPPARASKTSITPPPRTRRAVIRQLATCRWVAEHQNSSSPARPASARRFSAARSGSRPAAGHRAIYRRIAAPLSPSSPSRTPTAPTPTLLARFARVDVLVLDDWGLVAAQRRAAPGPPRDPRRPRRRRSTVITSQLPARPLARVSRRSDPRRRHPRPRRPSRASRSRSAGPRAESRTGTVRRRRTEEDA